jgi:hypothetical protein
VRRNELHEQRGNLAEVGAVVGMAGLEGMLGSRASTGFCTMLTPPRALMARCTVLVATGQHNPDTGSPNASAAEQKSGSAAGRVWCAFGPLLRCSRPSGSTVR